MKGIAAKATNSLSIGARLTCADNSGAKILQIIAVPRFKARHRQIPRGGIGSLIRCRVYSGNEKVRHQVFRAIIVRQRKEYRRPSGLRVSFEDNAAIIVDEKGVPKGTIIKGPIAKEAVERLPTIAKIASQVV